jgi:acetyltransferase
MVVIVTPAPTVPAIAEECGKKKVKTIVVISAGFGETGTDQGHAAEELLKKTCATYGMSMVGPNCLGILRPSIGLNASFAARARIAKTVTAVVFDEVKRFRQKYNGAV